MASNQAKAQSTFQLKRSLPEGGVQTSCATHGEKRSLDAASESQTPQFRKDLLTRCYCMAGIIKHIKVSCTVGTACLYGVRICTCFLRYKMKALLDQQPFTFMTSKGTPCRRYSTVDPIWIPWPCKGSRPAVWVAFANSEMNLDLVRGLCPDLWR